MNDLSRFGPGQNRLRLNYLAICLVILTSVTACRGWVPMAVPTQGSQNSIVLASPSVERTSMRLSAAPVVRTQTPVRPTPVAFKVPPVWDYLMDDFEGGSLVKWGQVSEPNLRLIDGEGHNGSTGLAINVHKRETYLYKTDIVKTTEGYFTFWFNPNSVNIPDETDLPIQGKSIRIADIKGYRQYAVIASLRIWKPKGSDQSYKAFLEWQAEDGSQANLVSHYDTDTGQFDLTNGWQKITLGFRINDWVAVWVNDKLMREVHGVSHAEDYAEIIEYGKANDDNSITPAGSLRYDEVAFQLPRLKDLWVDAANGNDTSNGLERSTAFRSIQKAANLAGPGTKVHILPGIYRETVSPALDGSPAEPTLYTAEAGHGSVIIRGSESSTGLAWRRLESNTIGLPAGVDISHVYYTDLSAWKMEEAPRFLVTLDEQGSIVSRLPLAREPDWTVKTEWKTHEFWWSADGGSVNAACDPSTDVNSNCDLPTRSMTQLTDSTSDSSPLGIEAGNLTTLGSLTGATLVAIDTKQGHYVYRRVITGHDISAGRITVDRRCEHDDGSGNPGLGWGTKYYVEGKPNLMDTPGEWWYDIQGGQLYLYSPSGNPASLNLEITRQKNGFNLSQRSNIILDGLTIELFDGSAVYGYNETNQKSANNSLLNLTLRYANHGVSLEQNAGDDPQNIISHTTIEQSEIAYTDSEGMQLSYTWKNESAPASFQFAGITSTLIRANQLHHLGFRSDGDNAIGVSFLHADHLTFENNHVHHVAHNGVQFSWSVIQSNKMYGFSPDEIKTGDLLIKDNVFEYACQLTTDCGALKFWGDPPAGHIYRDVLITGNIFRNTFGWSSISQKRGQWIGGTASDVQGMGGFGLYIDMASGLSIYRNIAYNNAFAGISLAGVWRDADILIYNNVLANSLYGLFLTGLEFDTHPNVNTQVVNNILANNEGHGVWFTETGRDPGNITVDSNLYFNNGWRSSELGGVWQPGALIIRRGQESYEIHSSLTDIQAKTPWEAHGLEGDPQFVQFDLSDHNLFDSSWPDFHIQAVNSMVIDRGTEVLPKPLTELLKKFNVSDQRIGSAYDIGPYELGNR